ncbi:MAG: ABC transporter permease [Bacteroidales bacterium]|nr:ABC transporter permease [Bacteroidales bacterium]
MDVSRFISRKLRFQGNIAAVSIAVSFFVMILAVTISSGFRHAVRDGVAAITGDIQISSIHSAGLMGENPIPASLSEGSGVASLPGVAGIDPVAFRAGIVRSGDIIHGVLVKGVTDYPDSSLTVSIPKRLSELTGLGEGDSMLTYFVGEKVKVRKFRIARVHDDLIEFDENLVVYAPIGDIRRVNEWDDDEASLLEVSLLSAMRSDRIVKELTGRIGTSLALSSDPGEQRLMATAAQDRYPQLFAWLNLLDFNVLFILILMTVVAGFNMISGLLIVLFRNIPTIGTLKTLGMGDRTISAVFLRVASGVVLKGVAVGNILALLFCLIQGTTHLIRLNPENYFVSYVPVHVNLPLILGADLVSLLAIMALLTLPTLFISRVDPATTVRMN